VKRSLPIVVLLLAVVSMTACSSGALPTLGTPTARPAVRGMATVPPTVTVVSPLALPPDVAVVGAETPTVSGSGQVTATDTGAAAGKCTDSAQMTKDVTIPDNTAVRSGQAFTKTWRLRNTGTCTWTQDYSVVFAKGEKMSGAESVALPSAVAPGESVDVSVEMQAPATLGTMKTNWQMRNADGKGFNIENSRDGTFWVQITVKK
jgi:hypothetical protein